MTRVLLWLLFSLVCSMSMAQTLDLPKAKYTLEQCMQNALGKYPGSVKSAEMGLDQGVPYYEYEIATVLDGNRWSVECDARTGDLSHIEREVKSDDAVFAKSARVSSADAMKAALARAAGMPREIRHLVGPDGKSWYEFAIVQRGGRLMSVTVEASNGQVISVEDSADQVLLYRIGDTED